KMIQEKLRTLRKQKKMSQETMAKILSTDTSSYSRKENGKSKIHDDEWEKLAKALEVSVDDIKESEFSGNCSQ
ncbi:helix-turn-helix transcriptional regulator, partial [Chryseobacterium sp. CCH4-E10]|uniref:helix-turn-helix transcriptional regulator n=1 Tax=Chryseobacterium sp. CCH4-E10 TaxID=1768758 RepID=UPI000AB02B45